MTRTLFHDFLGDSYWVYWFVGIGLLILLKYLANRLNARIVADSRQTQESRHPGQANAKSAADVLVEIASVQNSTDLDDESKQKKYEEIDRTLGDPRRFQGKLKAGDRLKLFGGYDNEQWLCGNKCCFGTIVDFRDGKAVVELDKPMTVNGIFGNILVLKLRHQNSKWTKTETVHVFLFENLESIRFPVANQARWIEAAADYDLVE